MTDEPGLYGVGDATLNGRELAVVAALQEHIAPLLIGRDPDRIEDTWQMLFRGAYWRGGPVLMTALAGIDTALWDIIISTIANTLDFSKSWAAYLKNPLQSLIDRL